MTKFKISIIIILFTVTSFLLGWFYRDLLKKKSRAVISSKSSEGQIKVLEKYTIKNLSQSEITPGKLIIDNVLEKNDDFTSYLFSYQFDADLDGVLDKTSSGMINLPNKAGGYPGILMLRGFVDQEIYQTGMGSKNAANFFAQNGFITVAPDFLGYAGSDPEAGNIFEARFQTYVTALSILKFLQDSSEFSLEFGNWTIGNLGLWGHSNGGQIALTVLEITQAEIPTVLWAPVSKPFPYSILYYTDESKDKGKLIRSELAKFEELYDIEKYSVTNYFDQIKAPLQLHQGTTDDAVPLEWSNNLNKTLLDLNLNLNYFTYSGADHNLQPSWDLVIQRSLDFFLQHSK